MKNDRENIKGETKRLQPNYLLCSLFDLFATMGSFAVEISTRSGQNQRGKNIESSFSTNTHAFLSYAVAKTVSFPVDYVFWI